MEALDKLKRERGQIRRIFTRHASIIEDAIKKNLPNETDMEYLQEKFNSLTTLDNKIQDMVLGATDYSEEKCDEEFDEAETYRRRWLVIKGQIDKKQPKSMSYTNQPSKPHNLKLPQLELRKFNDDPRSWVPFWSQFRKIHEDEAIDDDDKYQYLIQAMTPGSKARILVEGYAPTKGNYTNVVQMLKERFAKDEILIETYVREILKLVMSRNKVAVDVLYDQIVANLQTLETLGIVKEKYECILYPLVESSLPENVLLNWSRLPHTDKSRLTQLLGFLKTEVGALERLSLAKTDFFQKCVSADREASVPTATCLLSKETKGKKTEQTTNEGKNYACYFCDSPHNTIECNKGNKLSLEDKKQFIKTKGGCYICLKKGHLARHCKAFVNCLNCKKRHLVILCPALHNQATVSIPKNSDPETGKVLVNNFSSINSTTLLQTLIVKLSNNGREKKVRALLDSGSQRTYIKAGMAEEMQMEVTGSERLGHIVFGGIKKGVQVHRHIEFMVSNLDDTYKTKMRALEQPTLCGNLPKVHDADIIRKLQDQGIRLTDAKESISEISLLIGSDYLGSILESDLVQVEENLVAIKTKLGWTLQGPIQGIYNTIVTSHFAATIQEDSLEFMWNIETLGIKDPYVKESENTESEMLALFNENVSVNGEGRYEVSLMWKLGYPELESNYNQAYNRLLSTTKKLERTQNIEAYNDVFQDWINEGIIEEVKNDKKDEGHYLPHHAVVKLESATTKIRPVFDASAKDRNNNSLNACIEKGPNLIEFIPKLQILFRAGAYGLISDIKKAFLQIAVCPQDREKLKLLWWKDPNNKNEVTTYCHARVPFGVACSPFLLAATLNHHLQKHEDKYPATSKRLRESFYVDNCVTSFNSIEEKQTFVNEATTLMKMGQFELRGWMTNWNNTEEVPVSVLGMLWNQRRDTIECQLNLKKLTTKVTKRELLSVTQQIFDPLGLVCPVALVPKLIIQKAWLLKSGWDEKIPDDLEKEYVDWVSTLHYLKECQVPRRLTEAPLQECETSVHIFSDASKDAYAGCIFLRTNHGDKITVQLIIAKSRVAPIKRCISLPRLELMGALIASRLYIEVLRSGLLHPCKEYDVYCWTDSSVTLAWLKRQNTWKPFISNRVKEICKNTNKNDWNHLPGNSNPADLPSRGCSAKTLKKKSWWLGPQWLYLEKEHWPKSNLSNLKIDEETVNSEQVKNSAVHVEVISESFCSKLIHFNQYNKIVHLIARMLRMSPRIRGKYNISSDHIEIDEYKNAEETLIKLIQTEHFKKRENSGHKLLTIKEKGIIRVKTRLEYSNEPKDFIYPILLPGNEEIIKRMVQQQHRTMKHAGTQVMMSTLRDSFWIIGIRRLTKKVVSECMICKRYKARHYEVPQPPLPTDRIMNNAAFEVTGIDLAGPLYLKDNKKCWIVLYTCAVYRAIHLELTDSLSTPSFMMTLRRFIARRGRVRVIYTDNGTNFIGTTNLLKEVNWQEVETATNSYNIKWKLSVPAAPWWGGWWERLVRVVKEMLRRILGKSVVDWIELTTILCDCETIINSRPLTYVEMGEYKPLTPMMFLHSLPSSDTPDLDQIDHKSLNIRHKYLQQLREDFRRRFRNEYLSLLINKGREQRREPKVGEVVLIETESSRLNWPLGLIKDIFTGKDGCTRAAKVMTSTGEKVRAYQKLYPLELSASDDWIEQVSNRNNPVIQAPSSPANSVPTDDTEPQLTTMPPASTRSGRSITI